MKNLGQDIICLTGSRKQIRRNIWEDETGKCFVKWGGQYIEVVKSFGGTYKTVGYF